MKRVALLLLFALGCHAPDGETGPPHLSKTPLTPEQLAIYSDYLYHTYRPPRDAFDPKVIALSDVTMLRPPYQYNPTSRMRDECLKEIGNLPEGNVFRLLPEELNRPGKIEFVDPQTHRKREPNTFPNAPLNERPAGEDPQHPVLLLSEMAFDRTHKFAAFDYSYQCGGDCGTGGSVLYEKHEGHWTRSPRKCLFGIY
jgi:hypothetical protein